MEDGAVDLDKGPVRPVAHLVDGLGDGAFAHAGLSSDEDVGPGVGGVLHQGPQPLHGGAFEQQVGGGGPGPQLRDLLGVVLQGVLHPAVVPLDGVDLLHGHGVEADGVFQLPVGVKEGDAHGHHVFVGVVDGLGGADLLPPPDDLRRDAGGEGAVRLQISSGLAHDGVVGETEVLLIGLTDPQDDAVAVGDHHVVRQDQVVFRAEDLQKSLQIDPLVVKSGKRRNRHRRRPPMPDWMPVALFKNEYSIFKNE